MKRILTLITIFAITLTSCTTEEIVAVEEVFFEAPAFEIQGVNFNPNTNFDNDYRVREFYGFEVLPTDSTLVYILWETVDGQEIWRLVPQTVIFDDGNDLVYNFDFTQTWVEFFLEGSDLDNTPTSFTQNQTFRVIVVPTINVGRVDNSDINVVMQRHGITSFPRR